MVSRLDKKHDGGNAENTPSGQVRVLVLGDSGVGKTSLVHLILHGKPVVNPRRTVGCSVEVKHITCAGGSSSSSSMLVGRERDFFVEMWDLSGHERYKDCRSLFYSQINGVIFVYDRSQRKTKLSLQKWATELAACGTFSAPMSAFTAAGIPVPFLVIGNKTDIAPKNSGSSGNLVDVARHWVEKQGFLSAGDELPVTESFPGSGGLSASATEGRLDMEAVKRFFCDLIRRRYFGEENTKPSLPIWTSPTGSISPYHSRGRSLHDDDFDSSYTSLDGESAGYNAPVPAQLTLLPPPFPYPQQPLVTSEMHLAARSSSSIAKSSSWFTASNI